MSHRRDAQPGLRRPPVLTVVTVNHNSAPFIELLLDALDALTFHDYRCVIVDNDSCAADYERLAKAVQRHPTAVLERRRGLEVLGPLVPAAPSLLSRLRLSLLEPLAGNVAHGIALNELCRRIDTRYGAIVDADCVFLKKHWDRVLIERLESSGASVMGGVASEEPFAPFPSVRCLLFDATVLRGLDVDFTPLKSVFLDRNPRLKRALRRRFSDDCALSPESQLDERRTFLDVGWHLSQRCRERGVPWIVLESRPAEGRLAGHEGTEVFLDRGSLVAAHFMRGSWPLAWKQRPRSPFLRLLYLSSVLWPLCQRRRERDEKERWLARCRTIVEEEARSGAAIASNAVVGCAVPG